jgi:hypothetical protein
MTPRLSEQRLAEILARAAAATNGPWCTDSWEIYQGTEYVPGMSFWIGETCRGTADLAQDAADAAFVAAARTDVPELVAEVQFLRAQVAGLESSVHDLTPSEQQFLTFALELAADRMAERGDEFDAADDAALESLRRLTGGAA